MLKTTFIALDVHAKTVTAAALNADTGEIDQMRTVDGGFRIGVATASSVSAFGHLRACSRRAPSIEWSCLNAPAGHP